MKPVWFLPLFFLTFAIPARGQSKQPPSKVDSLLRSASDRLNNYQQQIAPDIHCADETEEALRYACEVYLKKLNDAVQDAATNIANYRQVTTPQTVDLFDIYEDFHRILFNAELLAAHSDSYELHSQHNHELFADTYNNFIKLTGWFGSVMRDGIKQADRRCADPPKVF
jgi:hypothetical protein